MNNQEPFDNNEKVNNNDSVNKQQSFVTGPIISDVTEGNTQFQHYHSEKGGHGFAAEDANALHDRLHGRSVDKIGVDNTLNGPDRIVDGVPVQTKYYQTPKQTVQAAFDSTTKMYRYQGQQLEVPSDQYEQCLEIMKEKIRSGLVKDASGNVINDPEKAKDIIRKGSVTYQQAKNIAKAGNIDSLIFDFKNNIVTTGYIGGIAFVISFARYKWSGISTKDALRCSVSDAMQAGSVAMLTGIFSSQLMRTRTAASLTVLARPGVRAVYHSSTLGKNVIEKLAELTAKKALHGAAAINTVSKLLRSNIVTSCVSTAVITAPDFYRATTGSMSWAQFGKNLAVNGAGVAGGVGGWMAGAAAGAAAGSVIPGVGTAVGGIIGGLIGAFGGGSLASATTKAGLDYLVKDDAEEMLEILQGVFENLCFDFLLSEKEVAIAQEKLGRIVNESWLRDMYKYGEYSRKSWAYNQLEPIFESIISKRPRIEMPTEEEMDDVFSDIINIINDDMSDSQNVKNVDYRRNNVSQDNLEREILEYISNDNFIRYGYRAEDVRKKIKSVSLQDIKEKLDVLYNKGFLNREYKKFVFFYSITDKGRRKLKEFIQSLTDENIKENESKEIETAKCKSCGSELPANAKFCPKCGTKTETTPVCPECGHKGNIEEKFCIMCGSKLI